MDIVLSNVHDILFVAVLRDTENWSDDTKSAVVGIFVFLANQYRETPNAVVEYFRDLFARGVNIEEVLANVQDRLDLETLFAYREIMKEALDLGTTSRNAIKRIDRYL